MRNLPTNLEMRLRSILKDAGEDFSKAIEATIMLQVQSMKHKAECFILKY